MGDRLQFEPLRFLFGELGLHVDVSQDGVDSHAAGADEVLSLRVRARKEVCEGFLVDLPGKAQRLGGFAEPGGFPVQEVWVVLQQILPGRVWCLGAADAQHVSDSVEARRLM